jgi:hypothetical protein
MSVGQEHHQSVTVAVAIGLGRLDQCHTAITGRLNLRLSVNPAPVRPSCVKPRRPWWRAAFSVTSRIFSTNAFRGGLNAATNEPHGSAVNHGRVQVRSDALRQQQQRSSNVADLYDELARNIPAGVLIAQS